MGLTAFAMAAIAGWAVQNPLSTILTRSIIAMVVCYAVGHVLAWVATKVAHEHIDAYRARNLIPTSPSVEAPVLDAQDPRNPDSPDNPTPESLEAEPSRAAA